jgi:hypothetical protein
MKAYKWNTQVWKTQRLFTDFMVSSHLFLIPSIPICFIFGNIELGILMIPVIILSTIYHKSQESKYYISEAIFAHLLMFYTTSQIIFAPKSWIFLTELSFFGMVLMLFFGLSYHPEKYNTLHPYQHIIASLWVSLIGIYHTPYYF